MLAPLFAIMMIGTNSLDPNDVVPAAFKMQVSQTIPKPYPAFMRHIAYRAEDCQTLDFSKLKPASKYVISAQLSGVSFNICTQAWAAQSSISLNKSGIYRTKSGLISDDIGEALIVDGAIRFISSGDRQPFVIYLYQNEAGNLFGTAHPEYSGATNVVVFTHDVSTMFDR